MNNLVLDIQSKMKDDLYIEYQISQKDKLIQEKDKTKADEEEKMKTKEEWINW